MPVFNMGKPTGLLPEQTCATSQSADWLPEEHLAYFVSDLIDELDLSAIESYYEQEERVIRRTTHG